MTPWAIVNTSRAWTVYVSVTASGVVTSASSSNVYDGTVSMSIPGQASGGYLNYYICWQSAMKLMQTYRDKMKAMPARRINAWRDYSRRTTRISTGGHGLRLSGRRRGLEHRSEDGNVGLLGDDYGNRRLVPAQDMA